MSIGADVMERVRAMAGTTDAGSDEAKAAKPVVLTGMQGWKEGDAVWVQGLQSAGGQKLNGRSGLIVSYLESTNRFQVEMGPGETHSLKAENFRYNEKGHVAAPAKSTKRKSKSSSSSSSSESSAAKRARKRKKKSQCSFSNFTSFDASGSAYSGRTREEMTAEELLHEAMHGPMTMTERDLYVRGKTAERKEEAEAAVPTPAAGALKVGDPVIVFGLQSASGQKQNGRSGVISSFIEASGRFQVRLGPGEAIALKRENLKYNADVPEWMRD